MIPKIWADWASRNRSAGVYLVPRTHGTAKAPAARCLLVVTYRFPRTCETPRVLAGRCLIAVVYRAPKRRVTPMALSANCLLVVTYQDPKTHGIPMALLPRYLTDDGLSPEATETSLRWES